MIINAKAGRAAIQSGKARYEGIVITGEGQRYAIITMYSPQRTDHYPVDDETGEA